MFDLEKVTRALIVGEDFSLIELKEISLDKSICSPKKAHDRPSKTTRPEGLHHVEYCVRFRVQCLRGIAYGLIHL